MWSSNRGAHSAHILSAKKNPNSGIKVTAMTINSLLLIKTAKQYLHFKL